VNDCRFYPKKKEEGRKRKEQRYEKRKFLSRKGGKRSDGREVNEGGEVGKEAEDWWRERESKNNLQRRIRGREGWMEVDGHRAP